MLLCREEYQFSYNGSLKTSDSGHSLASAPKGWYLTLMSDPLKPNCAFKTPRNHMIFDMKYEHMQIKEILSHC